MEYIYIYIHRRADSPCSVYIPKKLQFAANGQFVLVFSRVGPGFVLFWSHPEKKVDSVVTNRCK